MNPEFSNNRICQLLGISCPIIQAGMIWASGWRLASAVSNTGGLGVLGAGSMYPEVLREQIQKCKQATDKPFAVNLPLLYVEIEKHIEIILENKVPIVFTSAGSPRTWTPLLREKGIKVIHVVSSAAFAQKAEAAGHNGREQTTTLVLVPQVVRAVSIPVIAAGGIATGEQMLAAMALGASGVQIGTRFVASEESSAHPDFKKMVIESNEGDTQLVMHKLVPVRLLKNDFYRRIEAAESRGASAEELKEILGRARAKKGMFEGDLQEGELEIGQVASLLDDILPAATIVLNLLSDYGSRLNAMQQGH
jgi:enoyl-[acyl-carrier protein] reductase II